MVRHCAPDVRFTSVEGKLGGRGERQRERERERERQRHRKVRTVKKVIERIENKDI